MALLSNPQVLFLDEPLEAIDPVTAKTITDLLVTLRQRGITVFLTSHILAAVEQFATRVVLIRKGVVAWNSTDRGSAGLARKAVFRPGGSTGGRGPGMVRVLAVLKAVWARGTARARIVHLDRHE